MPKPYPSYHEWPKNDIYIHTLAYSIQGGRATVRTTLNMATLNDKGLPCSDHFGLAAAQTY